MEPDPNPNPNVRPVPDAILSELARLRAVERVALEFCARCERGEIRSVGTYARFRAALAGGDETCAAGAAAAAAATVTRL